MKISQSSSWYQFIRWFNSDLFWRYENGYVDLNTCAYIRHSLFAIIEFLFIFASGSIVLLAYFSIWIYALFGWAFTDGALGLSIFLNGMTAAAVLIFAVKEYYKTWKANRPYKEKKIKPSKEPNLLWQSIKAHHDKFCAKIEITD